MKPETIKLLNDRFDELLGGPEYNGPEYEDGHDYEGFVGGCKRFGCPGGNECTALNKQKDTL